MPSTTTLLQLRTQARQRADMENSSFVADSELTTMINYELGDLYDLLVATYDDYFISTSNIAVVSGTEAYSLPNDFYKLRAVFLRDSGQTQRWRLYRDDLQDFDNGDLDFYPTNQLRYMRYRILGSNIYFSPIPNGSATVQLFYVPEMTKLSADGDTISFSVPTQGWEQYVVAGAAARMLIKEESDPTGLLSEQARIKDKVIQMASNRDSANSDRMRDMNARFRSDRWMY